MTAIEMRLGGRCYRIDCLSGQEARLERIARVVEESAAALAEEDASGSAEKDEGRFLSMTALVLADRLAEAEDALARRSEASEAVEIAAETRSEPSGGAERGQNDAASPQAGSDIPDMEAPGRAEALSPALAAAVADALDAAAARMDRLTARLERI